MGNHIHFFYTVFERTFFRIYIKRLISWHLCGRLYVANQRNVTMYLKWLNTVFQCMCIQWFTFNDMNVGHYDHHTQFSYYIDGTTQVFSPLWGLLYQTQTICQGIRCLGKSEPSRLRCGWRNLVSLQAGNVKAFSVKGDHHCCSYQCCPTCCIVFLLCSCCNIRGGVSFCMYDTFISYLNSIGRISNTTKPTLKSWETWAVNCLLQSTYWRLSF